MTDIINPGLTPPYAGAGVISPIFTFNAPSPITGSHQIGYQPGTTQLHIATNSADNVLAITQNNSNGLAAITFRGKDANYSDPTAVFEHGAIGWCAQGAQFVFLEASRFDGVHDIRLPPPTFIFFQTGSVDTTGGTTQTCGITNLSTTVTSATNLPATGTVITGTGIPAMTTLSSGGGTTSGVMSNAATATNASASLNFSTPVYGTYNVINFSQTGNIDFHNWASGALLSLDRVNTRVGFGTSTPTVTCDVNGAGKFNGNLTILSAGTLIAQGGMSLAMDYNVPTTGQTYTLPAAKSGCTFEPVGTLAALTVKMPAAPVAGQVVSFGFTQAITALTVSPNSGQVIRANTTPTSMAAGGTFSMVYNANTVWYPTT